MSEDCRATVCHVTSAHQPMDSRVLYHECRSLAKHYRTVLVCRDDGPSREAEGVEIVTVPKARGRIGRFLGRRELIRIAEGLEADLYHFHDPELMEPMLALGRRTGKPVVYDVHEDYPSAMDQKAWIPAPLRPVAASWADRTEHRCAPHTRRSSLPTRRFASVSSRWPRMLSSWTTTRRSKCSVARCRALTGPPTMVYVGSVSEMRGFHEMVGVLRGVHEVRSDARLVVYGRPTEEVAPQLDATIASFPEGTIEFRGPIPYGRIREALAEATVGLSLLRPHPKYEKNVSMKVFDYMALGVPWVASDFAPLRDATRRGRRRARTAWARLPPRPRRCSASSRSPSARRSSRRRGVRRSRSG